ncbi:hypothetical protein ASPBRDRAFT_267049 [Aspergillus brasiliensis CBS 101740]|uniref:Uncharacterized protein n=1 Tax=Aspergillus brasiliensis (strain CBS 101740 / IMI 381727 / IBT 21946) TaxID=767769 RepID=A0A1L9V344_ASPBC|nr:hypothetical protein ASPBRDRAFT_267049 [Aspergillus brasiliensis CBS 101740]
MYGVYPFEPSRRSTCCDGCMPRRTGDPVPSHRDHPIDLPIEGVKQTGTSRILLLLWELTKSPLTNSLSFEGVSQRWSGLSSPFREGREKEDDGGRMGSIERARARRE